jgi:glutathione S-transferase
MAVKLHRCSLMWAKMGSHPCWRVQKALDEAGVEYELVTYPPLLRGRRKEYGELTGGTTDLPAIQLEDGTVIREESKDLARRIEAGELPPQPAQPAA